jgi:hypothetical protein
MRACSRPRLVSFSIFSLFAVGSGFAGALFANAPHAISHAPAPSALQELAADRPRAFPDAVTLQARALAGELECTHLLTGAEIDALQVRIDQLNELSYEITTVLHERMAVATDEMIARGALAPAAALSREEPEGVIGYRITEQGGVTYKHAFKLGDDAQIDALQAQLEAVNEWANLEVWEAFN